MRTFALLTVFLAVASGLAHAQIGQLPVAPGEEIVDRVVAVVGDTALLLSDVQAELAQLASAGQMPTDPEARERFAQRLLESRVNDLILIVAAREDGLSVPDDQISGQVDQQIQQVQQRFGSEAAFIRALEGSGLTRDQYRQTLLAQVRDEALASEFLRTRLSSRARPLIDESAIQTFFEEQRAALGERPATVTFEQVVVAPEASAEARAAAIAEAQQVLDELVTGGSFEVLARRFSDDVGSAEHGGDLGWFRTGRMVPEFERAAFSLRPGQTSGIVESDFGYHIIRLERTRGAERQARHILIQPEINEADQAVARARADSVATAIRDGASVASLARRYNGEEHLAAVTSAVDGLPSGYAQALATAETGDLVGPFEMEDPRGNRWAVIKLTTRSPAGAYTIDDVREQIRDRLQQQALVEQLLIELRDHVYVNIRM